MGAVLTTFYRMVRGVFMSLVGGYPKADMSGPLAQFVKDTIKKDVVVIFSKSYCPFCTMAKDVFKKIDRSYTCIELDKRDDGDMIQSILGEITGARSVPRVFIHGEFVGGGTDVVALYENGKLQSLLDHSASAN